MLEIAQCESLAAVAQSGYHEVALSENPALFGVSHIMPSGNVPLGTLDAGSVSPRFSSTDFSNQPAAELRREGRSSLAAGHWCRLSFRTQLTLVCLQVFVLLAAGLGLLISAQHKRAQVHRHNAPTRFESAAIHAAVLPAIPSAAPDSGDAVLAANVETIRGQSPLAGTDDTAVAHSEIADLPCADLAAISAAAEMASIAHNSSPQGSSPLRAQDNSASGQIVVQIQPSTAAPFKNLVMSRPRNGATVGDVPTGVAPRSTRRATRIVNSVQQPAAADSRHRTAVRKRRWDSSAERRAAARGETLPHPTRR